MRSGCVSLNNCYSVSGAFGCENWVEGAFGCGAQYRTYRTSEKNQDSFSGQRDEPYLAKHRSYYFRKVSLSFLIPKDAIRAPNQRAKHSIQCARSQKTLPLAMILLIHYKTRRPAQILETIVIHYGFLLSFTVNNQSRTVSCHAGLWNIYLVELSQMTFLL